jgi:fibronectin-binding autotransporter adhesin
MKQFFTRPLFFIVFLVILATHPTEAAVLRNWINTAGGNWFDPVNWSPAGVPAAADAVTITNIGTYTVLIPTGVVATATITLGGASGTQTLVYGTLASKWGLTNSTVQGNGVLWVTNSGLYGSITVKQGGELRLDSPNGLQLYSFAITNAGTLTWSNGSVSVGGSNSEFSYLTNSGFFLITGDFNLGSGGGGRNVLYNAGLIRKSSGTGVSGLTGIDLINLPSGVVDVLSGTLQLSAYGTNNLSSSFTATFPGLIKFTGKVTDSGATTAGTGTFQFTFGTFYFQTNTIPGIKLIGGDLYITGTSTFQNTGAITNLTLDGAVLHGTNRVSGTLTINAGDINDTMTVLPSGQLNFAGTSSLLYGDTLINQGTINWSGGNLAVGGTPGTVVSNGGTWTITGDAAMSYGGGNPPYFTNAGVFQKTGGTAVSTVGSLNFVNLPSGVVRAASGTVQLSNNYTNTAGELRLNGGTITAFGNLGMTGGTLDGSGTIGVAAAFDGGTVAPGPGTGVIAFKSSLTLGTNVVLALDGSGTVPGVSYDQLSVTGAVAISNCTLQVSSLPSVPVGTTFVIITNTTASGTTGSFNGLAENAQLTISGQPFRIHYVGGDGNDVVLVRDSLAGVGPQLSNGGYTNKTFRVLGAGGGSTIFTIQASTNLVQWTNIGTATGDISGHFNFTDTNAVNFIRRFYRTTN